MAQVVYDRKEQYQQIESGLMPGEQIIAVYDAIGVGTGFIGLTSLRVILQDNSFVGKKVALTSVPYSKVTAVSFVSDKSMFGKFASTSSISISVGGRDYGVDFRGEEKARHSHDVVLWHITR
jgi:PH (Pleckstrin Homology) domain-containing protein